MDEDARVKMENAIFGRNFNFCGESYTVQKTISALYGNTLPAKIEKNEVTLL